MAKYIAKCLECGKDYENYDASPRPYCSVACQFADYTELDIEMDIELTLNSTDRCEIDNLRASFDPKLSSKANVLQLLKLASDKGSHYQADMALLALINDPDVTAAYLDVYKEYD
jgi:endogenous inhibitor of DNA gyrase (YacG/DUF329 family)